MSDSVALHELRHICGCAVAFPALDLPEYTYNQTEVFVESKTREGAALVVMPNATDRKSIERENEHVMALCAMAPLARVGADKALAVIRRGDTDEIVKAGGLSEGDIEAALDYTGPALLPARIVVGVALLEEKLGPAKFLTLARGLRNTANLCKRQDQRLFLPDVVPWAKAKMAHRNAKAYLAEAVRPKFKSNRRPGSVGALITGAQNDP